MGEGYSSRLFREVRDRRGLAYSIGSAFASYSDAGTWNVWAGVAPERLESALEVIGDVLRDVRESGVGDDEMEAAREHLRGSLVLGFLAGARAVAAGHEGETSPEPTPDARVAPVSGC